MPEGNTNEISNEPAQTNIEAGSNGVVASNNNDVLEKLSSNIENINKRIEKASIFSTSNYIQITNLNSNVNVLSSNVDVLSSDTKEFKNITQQDIIKIIQDINELKENQNNTHQDLDKSDEKVKDEKDNNVDENPDNEAEDLEKTKKKKGFMSKVARMVTSMLPSKLFKQQKEQKSTSKLDEKIYNVKISSFSHTANNQLINNLKQVLKIEKKKESFVTKSNMLKLAILAFTGMLIYLLFQIKEVREAFSNWIGGIKGDIISIKDSIVAFFNEQIENLSKLFTQPLSKTIDSLVESCKSLYSKVSEPIKIIFNSFGSLKDGLVNAWKAIKSMSSADIMKLFRNAFNKLKLAINEFLGWNVFKIEQEQPQGEVTDETATKSDSTPGNVTINPQPGAADKDDKSQQPPIKVDGDTITNKNTAINNQQAILKDGNTTLGGSTLKLQNGTVFNLHKNDDVYIANKPGGVIHGIFQEINSNYSNVKTIFVENFKTIIKNIENQDKAFTSLVDKLSIKTNDQLIIDTNTNIKNLQSQIDILTQKTRDNPITYTGVSTMRNDCRAKLI